MTEQERDVMTEPVPLVGEVAVSPVRVVEALVVRPGDHLLVTVPDDRGLDPAGVERLRDSLREHFPGVEVTVLAGASVALHRAEET